MSTREKDGKVYKAELLTAEAISANIVELEKVLRPAFKKCHGELEAIDALILGMSGKVLVFNGSVNSQINAALVLEPLKYPRLYVLNFLAYAGAAREFYWFYAEIEQWARDNNFDELRGYGDEATMRVARRFHQWEEKYRVYGKRLR